jgi:vacuolar-type H+-ATPase catalytic subunit A/Vma1
MLKCIVTLYEESQKAIADSPAEKRITWSYIKTTLAHIIQKVQETKFLEPKMHKAEIKATYDVLVKEIEDAFQTLTDA